MTVVHLIPEERLLIIFNRETQEVKPILLPASQIRALADEFSQAVLHLARPKELEVIEPISLL